MYFPKKLKEMLKYIIVKCSKENMPCDFEKAIWIAFHADMNHYVKHGKSISGVKWIKGDRYPVPASWRSLIGKE